MSSGAPYDPFEPHGNDTINNIKKEIDHTTDIMRENIERVQKRGNDLDNLQTQADVLNTSASGFKRSANDARKHFWWQNFKMKICLIVLVIVLIIVVVVPIAVHFK